MSLDIEIQELTPKLWPALETLFGKNGACAGCWCMFWRLEEGERFADVKGAPAKQRMKALVDEGKAQGLLAFVDGHPVGWLTLGPRRSFPRLDRAPSLRCDDADDVWSVPCFFIHKDFRGQGVATVLLKAALDVMRQRGARTVEGYPVKPPKGSARTSNASAYTGTVPFFEKQGFELVAERPQGKQRVRKALASPARAPRRAASKRIR
ncbi:GNAT family N-acetyltransferase [Myxococcus sp. CA051A]|uniref:GNAT family N-acetyltransferase n=1 Tax=Myxococcus llanfairpwllgwyngyllgogerychwyrndrobwllllantysiliogogogochensis TaxID=2590453 RepID=A0A540WJN4_9BACT|nr:MULTISPECIES: GNAT family N-acetyltransferase [Myxococcus]NTX08897.1 GNAT family N-acetyltransferase [Myxococcus sp. CA040A]NTX40815.1 GNAT family N-acetyltransferase [Myxococcus sp. CA033]NTX63512.1 GNAT family N-acetyltransferase [Myxococcus sp. CA051A]TQF09225.1 GNAT family N-acetyltransferase [Myxococcus llanfairpwllgwyngyllgogerychwyrndrobwllllantysiliogogogochensis]